MRKENRLGILKGITHRPDRRKVTLNRIVHFNDGDDVERVVIDALLSRKDRGRPFVGDSVSLTIPGMPTRTLVYVVETSPVAPGGLTLELQS